MVFIYSYIFTPDKNNYPIHSLCVLQPCASTGLSRAFSEIVRLNIDKALVYNANSLKIFSFFLIQLFLRVAVSVIYINKLISKSYLIITDSVISILLFIILFKSLILF